MLGKAMKLQGSQRSLVVVAARATAKRDVLQRARDDEASGCGSGADAAETGRGGVRGDGEGKDPDGE